jgi:hypothetical protein
MLIDAQQRFSNAQAVTSTAVGTNVIDLTADRSINTGEPMGVVFLVTVAADQTTGDEDYTFDVEYASAAAQDAGVQLAGRLKFESGTPDAPYLDADLLVAGFQFVIPLGPAVVSQTARYLGVRYVTAGTSPTITVSSWLSPLSLVATLNTFPDAVSIQ